MTHEKQPDQHPLPAIHGNHGAADERGARVARRHARAGRRHRRAHRAGDQAQGDLLAAAHQAHPAQGRAADLPEEAHRQGPLDQQGRRGPGAGGGQGRGRVSHQPHPLQPHGGHLRAQARQHRHADGHPDRRRERNPQGDGQAHDHRDLLGHSGRQHRGSDAATRSPRRPSTRRSPSSRTWSFR